MFSTFVVFDIVGIIAFAISGYFYGVRHRLDVLGVFIAACATAFSGGIIRDLIVGRIPIVFSDFYPSITAIVTFIVLMFFRSYLKESMQRANLFIVFDSIGLSTFAIIGALVGIEYGLNSFGVVFVGFITAVGGSIVRDVLVNDIPYIMQKDIYGTVAIAIACVVLFLNKMQLQSVYIHIFLVLVGVAARLIVVRKNLHLPVM